MNEERMEAMHDFVMDNIPDDYVNVEDITPSWVIENFTDSDLALLKILLMKK